MTSNKRAHAVLAGGAVVPAPAPAAKKVKKPKKSLAQLHAEKDTARLALAQTLDAIEDSANLPKKVKRSAGRLGAMLRKTGREQPFALLAIAIGVAGAIGTAVWWAVARFTSD